MKTGVIKYQQYEENVLLNEHFSVDELFKIVTQDRDFIKFTVFDEKKEMIISTDFRDTSVGAKYIFVLPNDVKKHVDILGTTYDAYKTPQYTHRTKTSWKVGSYPFKTRKSAHLFIETTNNRARKVLEDLVIIENSKTSENDHSPSKTKNHGKEK
jgi:hypothetical protein